MVCVTVTLKSYTIDVIGLLELQSLCTLSNKHNIGISIHINKLMVKTKLSLLQFYFGKCFIVVNVSHISIHHDGLYSVRVSNVMDFIVIVFSFVHKKVMISIIAAILMNFRKIQMYKYFFSSQEGAGYS